VTVGRSIDLNNRHRPVCQICLSHLERREKFVYADPFVAPATWCSICQLWWHEQSRARRGGGNGPQSHGEPL
jgi:hypothetical protein